MYGKIFKSMYDGSLYGQWEALVTFQQLIVLADREGFIDITPPALSARTGIPLKIIEKGITILESDDPYSRTEGENGKRLVLINPGRPWGWKIVNYEKYRDIATLEDRREYMRDYMKEYRKQEKFTDKQAVADGKQALAVLTHIDVDVDTDVNKKYIRVKFEKKVPIPTDFGLTENMIEYAESKRYNASLKKFTEQMILSAQSNGYKYKNWYSAWQNWLMKDIERNPDRQDKIKDYS